LLLVLFAFFLLVRYCIGWFIYGVFIEDILCAYPLFSLRHRVRDEMYIVFESNSPRPMIEIRKEKINCRDAVASMLRPPANIASRVHLSQCLDFEFAVGSLFPVLLFSCS
jgi:hypothetical protein